VRKLNGLWIVVNAAFLCKSRFLTAVSSAMLIDSELWTAGSTFFFCTTVPQHLLGMDLLDAVRALQVHEIVAQTAKHLRIANVAFFLQVLTKQIEHCGEGAPK
jgi:hypothetical protein